MTSNQQPAVLILGGDINALGHARALRHSGAPIYCALSPGLMSYGAATRYARKLRIPNPVDTPERAIDSLVRFASKQAVKPVLFFASDVWLHLFIEHSELLQAEFAVPYSTAEQLRSILYKDSLYELAERAGIPIPRTWNFENGEQLLSRIKELAYPTVVKPSQPGRACFKVIRLETELELTTWAEKIGLAGVETPLIAQEFIPGEATTLYTLTSYSNANGEMVAGSVGHKERQAPPRAGVITAGRLRHVPEVFAAGRQLLDSLQFHGLANTEFKYDASDGQYKLMEINPRLGVWNSSLLASGLNLAQAAYEDMQGIEYEGPPYTTEKDGLLWVNACADFTAHVLLRSTNYPDGGGMRALEWYGALQRPWYDGMLSLSDPGPTIAFLCMQTKKLLGRMVNRK